MNMNAKIVFGPNHGTQIPFTFRNSLFPLALISSKPVKNVGSLKTTVRASGDRDSKRTFKKVPPSEWVHHFLSVPIDISEVKVIEREIKELKPKVKEMLMPSQDVKETKKRMILIYLLVSLGLACHFEDEIDENLKLGFEKREEMMTGEVDLYTVSTIFWVFRTYGYNMPCDVFKRFKEKDSKFRECLTEDAKGMLSLYEAAQLATRADKILDEALSFTLGHLELLAEGGTSPPHISRLIKLSLYIPQHHNNEMIFAKWYIPFYEQEEDHDKMLLLFSKLNFRFLQLQWIQELKTLNMWWKKQDLASKLPPYFRERIVECYMFALGIQQQFSQERIIGAKFFILYTMWDDTCDRYAFFSEIKTFVECMERLVPDSMDSLPNYMKPLFKCTLDVFEECKNVGQFGEEGSYNVQDEVREEFKTLMRTYIPYGEWERGNKVPTFDELMEVGDTEVAIYASTALAFLDLGHIDMELAYKWLKSRPKLLQALSRKARLMNDMTGFEADMSRGYEVNVVNSYMKQHRVSKEETFMEFHKMLREINKLVNEEFLKTAKTMPINILQRAISCGNMTDVTYRDGDGLSDPIGKFKEHITSLFVDLMPL